MREVAILGIGQIKIDEHWEKSLREIGGEAAFAAMQDAGIEKVDSLYVGNMLAGSLSRQMHLGALLADFAGLTGIEAATIEAAGASAAMALRVATLAVASGMVDAAMVLGVEKLSDQVPAENKTPDSFFPGFWDGMGWGFGVGVQREGPLRGRYGWSGGQGTDFFVD